MCEEFFEKGVGLNRKFFEKLCQVGWVDGVLIAPFFMCTICFSADVLRDRAHFGLIASDIACLYGEQHIRSDWAWQICKKMSLIANEDFSQEVLKRVGCSQWELDALACEWCKKCRDLSIGLFVCKNGKKCIYDSNSQSCLYKKTLNFTKQGINSFCAQLCNFYADFNQTYLGGGTIAIFLFDPACKQKKGSTNFDYVFGGDMVLRVAEMVFNENTVQFLNFRRPIKFKNFTSWMGEYITLIRKSMVPIDWFCVDGSAVLAAYGLRDTMRDLDFIVHDEQVFKPWLNFKGSVPLDIHNGVWKNQVDAIIFNPINYFYINGFKVVSLSAIREFKKKRNEVKDQHDVALIDLIFKNSH